MGQGEGRVTPLVALFPAVFRSVERPELVLEEDDVALCDECCGLDSDGCPTCRGHRILHGYSQGGRGLPVVVEDTQGRASSGTPGRPEKWFANNRRSPAPSVA